MVADARRIAVRVLHRVVHDQAWASPALDAELGRSGAGRADAALATQIVYGTLRVASEIDTEIERHLARPVKVDDWVRAVLWAGTFQLLHLERTPAHAVVHDSVQLARDKRGKRVAGFVNAILRRVAADRPEHPERPSRVSVPSWLEDRLVASIGRERTEALLEVGAAPPSLDLRLRRDVDRAQLADAIRHARPHARITNTGLSLLGLRVAGAGDPRELPGYAEGAFAIQEEGAQLIGGLLDVRAGQSVLDVCAGRGGKTAQLVEAAGPRGRVVATDLHERRLEQITPELERLGLDRGCLETACVDWSIGRGGVLGEFDRVLVDAPCTGLGPLRRRPETLLRASPQLAAQMGDVQRRILHNAASMVRSGGSLLYAVCSPLVEEGAEVVAKVDLPGFRRVMEPPLGLKSLDFEPMDPLRLGPWVAGAGPWADAYQVFVWVNVG